MKTVRGLIARGVVSGNETPYRTSPIAQQAKPGYAGVLSKHVSVTPQRHCGFFAPMVRLESQTRLIATQWSAAPQRLQSVYDGMTRPNTKPSGNRSGGSNVPRVNPVTLNASQTFRAITQNTLGAAYHG